MKNLFFIFVYIMTLNSTFSYSVEDYLLFQEAQRDYKEGNFQNSVLKFRSLKSSFPNSPIVESNYYNFFFAMSLYEKGDLVSAFKSMEESVYTPANLNGKNYFQNERNYYLSKILIEQKKIEDASPYLLMLISDTVESGDKKYENFAFEILKNRNKKYELFYNLKYHSDFSYLDSFNEEELHTLGKYFQITKEYYGQEVVFEFLLKNYPKKDKYLSPYLSALFLQKKSHKLLDITGKLQNESDFPEIFYFRGQGFLLEKNYPLAILNLEKSLYLNVKYDKRWESRPARELMAIIYFTLEDYEKVIELLEKSFPLSKSEEGLLVDSYLKKGKILQGTSAANGYLKKYPFSNNGNRFYYILTGIDYRNKTYLDEFLNKNILRKYIDINSHLLSKMTNFKIDLKNIHSNSEVKRIFKVAKLKDAELLRLAMSRTKLLANDPISSAYLITQLYELGGFFHDAFENSFKNRDIFFRYSNLSKLLYPKYYNSFVENSAARYSIPENMIYATIRFSSNFNPNLQGSSERLGLMQIISKNIEDSSTLLFPEKNIDLGSKKLRELLVKNGGVKSAALIEYHFGEEVLKLLKFKNGDFSLDSVRDPLLKESINSLVSTYIFYEIFYPANKTKI